MTIDPDRTPVVVAVGQAIERDAIVSPLDLAERAARVALDAAPGVADVLDRLSLVAPLAAGTRSPATVVAQHLGLSSVACETTTVGGNTPQWLITRAAAAIAAGDLGASLIVGGEAMRSAKLGGGTPPSSGGSGERRPPDPMVGDNRPGVGPRETSVGLILPVHLYAMIESAIAARLGTADPAEHRVRLGRLLSPFTEVAAKQPFAWFDEPRTATEIATPTDDNRVVAEPYTKRMAAFLNVDQGAAVIVCSLAVARRAGIADGALFVWSGADCNDVWFPSTRPDLSQSPGIAAAARGTLEAAGVGVDDVTRFDLYSCFPSAVEVAVDALGLAPDDPRGLTMTGGLPYFGGPGNNYTTHAVATAFDQLREDGGGLALVSGLGWYVTKHSYGLYGSSPPPEGFRRVDTTDAQAAIDATAIDVVESVDGAQPAVVDASTVLYHRGTVTGAPVFATLPDGRRVVADAEPAELADLAGRSLVGGQVLVSGTSYRRQEV